MVAYRCTMLCEQFAELQEGGAANAVHVVVLSWVEGPASRLKRRSFRVWPRIWPMTCGVMSCLPGPDDIWLA
ncbi:hypothetical protein D9M73_244120 [compost metagenome]